MISKNKKIARVVGKLPLHCAVGSVPNIQEDPFEGVTVVLVNRFNEPMATQKIKV